MRYNILPPPVGQGTAEAQVGQIHRYLFRLSEQLNQALEQTDERIVNAETTATTAANSIKTAESEDLPSQYNRLRSLIIKTADIVRHEMDVMIGSLSSKYIAISDWGQYEENIQNDIEATAKEIVESYSYDSRLTSLEEDAAEFEEYRITTTGFIKRGIIGYDEDNVPIFGIAIGQDLRSTEVTIDGEVYDEIDMTRNLATYTADRVTFWQNGVQAGYFSNSELVVTRINVADRITLGGKWEISRTTGFTIRWIGDESNG